MKKLFADDQIEHLNNNKIFPWSSDTLNKSLKIRAAVGKNGYEYLRKVAKYPLPSYRTLCEKVEVLHIAPGMNMQVIDLLELKTKDMLARERMCVLLLDEVQLREKIEYDADLKKLVGYVSPEFASKGTNEPDDHALVFVIKGLCIPYKQPVVWFFTGKHTTGAELWEVTKNVVDELYKRGLFVKVVTSDMGGCNVGTWKQAGLNVTDSNSVSYIPHPCNDSQQLYFMADVPHLIKNMRNCLENKTLLLPPDVVQSNGLPCGEMSMTHIENIISSHEPRELKLVKGLLTEANIHPGKYAKMQVKNSTKVFSHRTASVLHEMADSGTVDV